MSLIELFSAALLQYEIRDVVPFPLDVASLQKLQSSYNAASCLPAVI
jgi:hypothetical protein